jgi:GNAT superfamily N-acetyltransferase
MEFAMIRPTTPADTNALMALAEASGLFEPSQTAELAEMLGQHFAGDSPDYWLTDEDQEPVGVAYVAPERMTQGTWNLYLMAVHPERQRQGRGKKLLEHVEQLLIDALGIFPQCPLESRSSNEFSHCGESANGSSNCPMISEID